MAKKKEQKNYNRVLGIDMGTSGRSGLALWHSNANSILEYTTVSRHNSKTNLEHRQNVVKAIYDINDKYPIDILIFESVRLFSYGRIQMGTILSLCKMQTTIINEFSDKFDIYQVDVRSWKSRVLGNANVDKDESIRYVQNKYPHINLLDEIVKPIKKEILLEINHDLADACAISESLKYDYSILQDKNKMNYK
jgi:hypothetical protein